MTIKLLEFDPSTADQNSTHVQRLIEEDVWMSCTPDMPALRYAGNIPVFIWDELGLYKGFSKLGVDSDDYYFAFHEAYTKDAMLPFYQRDEKNYASPFRNVLPSSPTWNKSLKDGSCVHLKARPVKGKIAHVNLFTLRLLDMKMNNTISHIRRKTTFTLPDGKTTQAWIYTMPTHIFTKYDPHANTYTLVDGFKPVEVNVSSPTDDSESSFVSRVPVSTSISYAGT